MFIEAILLIEYIIVNAIWRGSKKGSTRFCKCAFNLIVEYGEGLYMFYFENFIAVYL